MHPGATSAHEEGVESDGERELEVLVLVRVDIFVDDLKHPEVQFTEYHFF